MAALAIDSQSIVHGFKNKAFPGRQSLVGRFKAELRIRVNACAGGALVEVRYAVKANRIGENGGRTLSGWSRYGQSCIGNHGADLVVSLLRGFGKKIVSDGRTAGRRTEGGDAR